MRTLNRNDADIYSVADQLGIHYSGDCNLEHGGWFYNVECWKSYGYADVVDVSIDDGHLFVTVGSVNKYNELISEEALRNVYGPDISDILPNEHVEIDACKSHYGVNPYCGYDGPGDYMYPLNEDGTAFKTSSGWVSVDHLQGWVIDKFVEGITS